MIEGREEGKGTIKVGEKKEKQAERTALGKGGEEAVGVRGTKRGLKKPQKGGLSTWRKGKDTGQGRETAVREKKGK